MCSFAPFSHKGFAGRPVLSTTKSSFRSELAVDLVHNIFVQHNNKSRRNVLISLLGASTSDQHGVTGFDLLRNASLTLHHRLAVHTVGRYSTRIIKEPSPSYTTSFNQGFNFLTTLFSSNQWFGNLTAYNKIEDITKKKI